MALKWTSKENFEFDLKDEYGDDTGQKVRGKARRLSIMQIEILKEKLQPYFDEGVEPELEKLFQEHWSRLSSTKRFQVLRTIIMQGNRVIGEDELNSLDALEALDVALTMFGVRSHDTDDKDARFLSDSSDQTTQSGTASNADGKDLTANETVTES